MITRLAPAEHWPWIASRANLSLSPVFRAIEAVDDMGKVVGMVGFDGWTPSSCALHVAVDYPAALRSLLFAGFNIAFDQLGKRLVTAMVLSTNEKSLRLVRHLGFREAHRIVDGWDAGVDLVLFEMRRDECRFVSQKEKAA